MKWLNHKLLTGTIVFSVTNDPMAALAVASGSVIPDAVEGFPTTLNYYSWRSKHRQLSHWIVPYLIIFLFFGTYTFFYPTLTSLYDLWDLSQKPFLHSIPLFVWLVAMLSLGACFHIVEDALCGTVPGLILKKRVGLKLFTVGSWKEYLYVWSFSIGLLFLNFKANHFL